MEPGIPFNAIPGDSYNYGSYSDQGFDLAVGTMGFVSIAASSTAITACTNKQSSTLNVNPLLTVIVSNGLRLLPPCLSGVGVALIPTPDRRYRRGQHTELRHLAFRDGFLPGSGGQAVLHRAGQAGL